MSKIEGLDKLVAQLNRIKNVSPHALLAGAFVLLKYAMENAPVDTGFLRNSGEAVQDSDSAFVIFHALYSYYVEMGTSKTPANGFTRRAIDEHSNDIVKAVGEQVQKDIKGKI